MKPALCREDARGNTRMRTLLATASFLLMTVWTPAFCGSCLDSAGRSSRWHHHYRTCQAVPCPHCTISQPFPSRGTKKNLRTARCTAPIPGQPHFPASYVHATGCAGKNAAHRRGPPTQLQPPGGSSEILFPVRNRLPEITRFTAVHLPVSIFPIRSVVASMHALSLTFTALPCDGTPNEWDATTHSWGLGWCGSTVLGSSRCHHA